MKTHLPLLFIGLGLGFTFALTLLHTTKWGKRWMERSLRHHATVPPISE